MKAFLSSAKQQQAGECELEVKEKWVDEVGVWSNRRHDKLEVNDDFIKF